jgi:hypothetical protein
VQKHRLKPGKKEKSENEKARKRTEGLRWQKKY